jgi:hypothetical protein
VSELVRDKINEDDSLCIVSDDKTIRHSGSVSFMSTSVTSERAVMSCRLSVHLTALHCAVLYCTVLYCTVLYCMCCANLCDVPESQGLIVPKGKEGEVSVVRTRIT